VVGERSMAGEWRLLIFGMALGKVDEEFSFAAFRTYILVPFISIHNAQFRFCASSNDHCLSKPQTH
jgi:hypothetical protein